MAVYLNEVAATDTLNVIIMRDGKVILVGNITKSEAKELDRELHAKI